MRVFVTGATGWVGSAIVKDLIAAGHAVLGLARSEAGPNPSPRRAPKFIAARSKTSDSLKEAAAQSDAVIHTAFNHDFSKIAESGADEQRAIAALGRAGRLRPAAHRHLRHGGCGAGQSRDGTNPATPAPNFPFPRNPEAAVAALTPGVRASAVRLPPSVHGHGEQGFVPRVIGFAREKGVSPYVGDGLNRWPAVHRLDAARVYRLALERGAEGGPVPCGRRRRRAVQSDRRGHRPATERAGRLACHRKMRQSISAGSPGSWASTSRPRAKRPRSLLGLGARTGRAHRRYRSSGSFRKVEKRRTERQSP